MKKLLPPIAAQAKRASMPETTIAILMPGDMGHAVGQSLLEHGHPVVTCLAGRSERTRGLAEQAGLRDLPDLDTLVREANIILSILPPARAVEQAKAVADAAQRTGGKPHYVDCNAISPDTAKNVADAIAVAGTPFTDCGIIGLKPGNGPGPRFYVSGADTKPMEALDGKGFKVVNIGPEVGQASGLKMCYAALTKGTWTLHTALLMTAEVLGLSDVLEKEFAFSQETALAAMRKTLPRIPADSERWIGEMEEIAATFEAAGLPPGFHQGAAEIFRILSRTPFAEETRETLDPNRTLETSIRAYVEAIEDDAKT